MMDFLQRLAPSREGDGSRAVAALPSRFAAGGPLRAPIGPRQPEHDLDEDFSLAVDPAVGDSATDPGGHRGALHCARVSRRCPDMLQGRC